MREKNKKILGFLLAFMMFLNIFASSYEVGAASPTRDQQLQKVVNKALELEGINYNSPHHHHDIGFNCDGLIWYAYKEAIGHLVPMGPENLDEFGKEIRKEDLRPGDVITYDLKNVGRATHVALYVGKIPGYSKPQIIHAVRDGDGYKGRGGVILDDFDRYRPVKKYVRVYEETNAKVADFRVKRWVNLRANNGNQLYDRDILIGRFRAGDEIKNAIDYGNFVRFTYNENATAFAIKSTLEQISPYRDYKGSLTEEYNNGPIIPLIREFWTAEDAKVLSGPGTGYPIGTMPKGYFIEGAQIGAYYKIAYEGKEGLVDGYIFDAQLSKDRVADKGILLEDTSVVDKNGNSIGNLKLGQAVAGILENDKMEVKIDGRTGYILRNKILFDEPLKVWLKEDTRILSYPDQAIEEIEEYAPRGLQFNVIKLDDYYKIIKDEYTNIEGYIGFNDVSKTPIEIEVRVREDSQVGELGSDKILGTIDKGSYIKGNIIDGKFYFEYKGNYNAELSLEDIILNPEEEVEEIPEEYLNYWIKEDVELRDEDGVLIGSLRRGDQITASKEEGRYKLNYEVDENLIVVYLDEKYVSEDPIAKSLYLTKKTNIVDKKGNILGSLKKGDRIEGFLEEDRYRINYLVNGELKEGYIAADAVSEAPVAKDLYLKKDAGVKNDKGEIVDRLSKGDQVEGLLEGSSYHIFYTVGKEVREGYLAKDLLSEAPVAKDLYIKANVNVRNKDNKIIDKLSKGTEIEGLATGNYYKISYKIDGGLREGYVYKTFVSKDPVAKNLYVKSRVNVRNKDGKVVDRLTKGDQVEGLLKGNYYHISYKSNTGLKEGRVHKSFLSQKPIMKDLYIRARVNVRDENKKVIGKLQKGEKIEGLVVGNMIEFNYKNQKASLVKSFTREEPVKAGAYITAPVNVRDLNNNLLGRLGKGKYIEAKLIGNYYHFSWEGREAKIHKNFAQFDSPVKAKIAKTVNVRDGSGKVLGQKKAGDLVNVVSMGDYYRFFEAGREVFIWHSFVHIL